jgi:cold shock CspA family protein
MARRPPGRPVGGIDARAGMRNLNEAQKLSYDVVSERGKLAAANLQNV